MLFTSKRQTIRVLCWSRGIEWQKLKRVVVSWSIHCIVKFNALSAGFKERMGSSLSCWKNKEDMFPLVVHSSIHFTSTMLLSVIFWWSHLFAWLTMSRGWDLSSGKGDMAITAAYISHTACRWNKDVCLVLVSQNQWSRIILLQFRNVLIQGGHIPFTISSWNPHVVVSLVSFQ